VQTIPESVPTRECRKVEAYSTEKIDVWIGLAFYAKKQKREGKLVSTSLPSPGRKCNADLDYESVTDAPDWIVKVQFLLIRCHIFRGDINSPEMIHCQLKL
jgi:hypothetical protein